MTSPNRPSAQQIAYDNERRSQLFYDWIGKRIKTPSGRIGDVVGIDPRPIGYSEGDYLIIRLQDDPNNKWADSFTFIEVSKAVVCNANDA